MNRFLIYSRLRCERNDFVPRLRGNTFLLISVHPVIQSFDGTGLTGHACGYKSLIEPFTVEMNT